MITAETVTHVARLARLELTEDEVSQYTQELGKILELVDQLSELDLSDEAVGVVSEYPTTFREDAVKHPVSREELLANAPREEDGFFRVPKILEE